MAARHHRSVRLGARATAATGAPSGRAGGSALSRNRGRAAAPGHGRGVAAPRGHRLGWLGGTAAGAPTDGTGPGRAVDHRAGAGGQRRVDGAALGRSPAPALVRLNCGTTPRSTGGRIDGRAAGRARRAPRPRRRATRRAAVAAGLGALRSGTTSRRPGGGRHDGTGTGIGVVGSGAAARTRHGWPGTRTLGVARADDRAGRCGTGSGRRCARAGRLPSGGRRLPAPARSRARGVAVQVGPAALTRTADRAGLAGGAGGRGDPTVLTGRPVHAATRSGRLGRPLAGAARRLGGLRRAWPRAVDGPGRGGVRPAPADRGRGRAGVPTNRRPLGARSARAGRWASGGRHGAGSGPARHGRGARRRHDPRRRRAGGGTGRATVRAQIGALLLGRAQVVDPVEVLAADRLLRLAVGLAPPPPAALGAGVAPLVGAVLRTTRSHC
ncbi:hypothetical protein GA0070624_3033 [Micromonospora rhizosphaerae]|uniref:Uncharacterized protein n=1 Tax=Micromonospora rhizosphaerae TaxID=568872 RepID=A0A1C6S6L5_9ACTN|nr:hypothetical protein GA0070624_3033 [Micromonospora rhizosphaerae]